MNRNDSSRLAVVAPTFGLPSETFIRRHMTELFPARTVTVVAEHADTDSRFWDVEGPCLVHRGTIRRRLHRGVLRRTGRSFGLGRDPVIESFLRENETGVLLAEYLDWSLPYLDMSERLGIPVYCHAHGYDVSERRLREKRWRRAYQRLNSAAGIITMSQVSRQRLVSIGLDQARIHVIPYGVDVAGPPEDRPDMGAVRCLAVGRMVAKKAPLQLLEAFRQAAKQVNIMLDFVGQGELMPLVRQYTRDYVLEGKVRLHGVLPHAQVLQLMRQSDIFLQHSITDPDSGDEEGLPVAILEAMAAGLPVVSTRHAGIPEVVREGQTGFLVAEGDSAAMSRRLVRLAADRELRHRMGLAGWEHVSQSYSWKIECRELRRVLGLEEDVASGND